MDTCGFPKNAYYFHKAMYTSTPMLHIFPYWNWKDGEPVCVTTVTNCDEVELFLNGVSLGRRKNDVAEQNEWQIAFEPGVLFAVGYRDGEVLICAERRTAGKAAMICLRADRDSLIGNGSDATTVRVSLMDESGNILPTATDHVRFAIAGGRILGTGNGDPNSHEDDTKPCRDLFAGHAAAIIAADASEADRVLTVTASVDGLADAILEIPVTGAGEPLGVLPCKGRYITAFTASRESEDVPDYCRPIADNDMNSLIPISLGAVGDTFTRGGASTAP
jgi:beta-galactosidase